MKKQIRFLICSALLTVALLFSSGCGGEQPEMKTGDARNAGGSKTSGIGMLVADPNPIQVCDGSGSGVTTISWSFKGAKKIEVHIGSPDGQLFAAAEADGKWATGKWAGNGMIFYLQDVSDGHPLNADNTLATLVVHVTDAGCRKR